MHAGVDIDAINYTTKYTTKIKTKFSYCDQIKLNAGKYKTWTPGPWTPSMDRVHGPGP